MFYKKICNIILILILNIYLINFIKNKYFFLFYLNFITKYFKYINHHLANFDYLPKAPIPLGPPLPPFFILLS